MASSPVPPAPADDAAAAETELRELRTILDRLDGLTHEARMRLRRLERHQSGIDPNWLAHHH